MRQLVLAAMATSLLAACGGAQSTAPPPAEPEPEPVAQVETEPVAEPEPEPPPPTGPARLRVTQEVDGQEIDGPVRIVDSSGETVAEGRTGETFTLPAGTYRVSASIPDAAVLSDTPTREYERPITLDAEEERAVAIEHPIAHVRLRVTRGGSPVARWRAELTRQGTRGPALELGPTEEHVTVTAGRYDGTVHIGSTHVEVQNVIFPRGARADVPIIVN